MRSFNELEKELKNNVKNMTEAELIEEIKKSAKPANSRNSLESILTMIFCDELCKRVGVKTYLKLIAELD